MTAGWHDNEILRPSTEKTEQFMRRVPVSLTAFWLFLGMAFFVRLLSHVLEHLHSGTLKSISSPSHHIWFQDYQPCSPHPDTLFSGIHAVRMPCIW